MDPDRTLADILNLADEAQHGMLTHRERSALADDLVEKILGLDQWIREGGCLPKEWNNERRTDQPPRGSQPGYGEVRGPEQGYPPPFTIRRG